MVDTSITTSDKSHRSTNDIIAYIIIKKKMSIASEVLKNQIMNYYKYTTYNLKLKLFIYINLQGALEKDNKLRLTSEDELPEQSLGLVPCLLMPLKDICKVSAV